jgi:hypothetical protein
VIKSLLLLCIGTYLLAFEPVHSSVSSYFENKSFKNSVQKEDGYAYGFGADLHTNSSAFKLAYEIGKTDTKQPPLQEDLETKKIFFKYAYQFDKKFSLNINYLKVLKDNIAETNKGIALGGGGTYTFNKKLSVNFTEFYTDYEYFDVFQSDLRVDYKTRFEKLKVKFSSITKYISIHDEKDLNSPFIKNAQNRYLTSALKFHSHYKSYHLGGAVFFGKRVFAIMDDGFKIQHHAMEFDRTYAFGFGKNFSNLVLRTQYIYQRAEELPIKNKNVELHNIRVIANYKF